MAKFSKAALQGLHMMVHKKMGEIWETKIFPILLEEYEKNLETHPEQEFVTRVGALISEWESLNAEIEAMEEMANILKDKVRGELVSKKVEIPRYGIYTAESSRELLKNANLLGYPKREVTMPSLEEFTFLVELMGGTTTSEQLVDELTKAILKQRGLL